MRVRVWNAFASNNSGSYTIVGSFKEREVAADVAAELAELVRAHDAWRIREGARDESPLLAFVKKHHLTSNDDPDRSEDWPQYSRDNVPQVFAVDHNVVIHHDYTVTLPRAFGEYFYARGGRVDHELNHAHHPVVAIFELWVQWQERKGVDIAAKIASVLEELHAADGPLVTHVAPWHHPAWQSKDAFGEADLTLGVVFDDLLLGFSAVQRIAAAHGLRTRVRVFEEFGEADFLAFLRPSSPPLGTSGCSVVLEDVGYEVEAVAAAIGPFFRRHQGDVSPLLDSLPVTVLSGVVPARAERVAAALRPLGATVAVRADDPGVGTLAAPDRVS